MKNTKGFVLTETLVVTVFLVTIFTFIYVSIVPLLGKYEDLIYRESDMDIVYKLYNIKKMISVDTNRSNLVSGAYVVYNVDNTDAITTNNNQIICSKLANSSYCNKMFEYLELDKYILVYAKNINSSLSNFSSTSKVIREYIEKYRSLDKGVLVLFDKTNNTVAHIVSPVNYD